MQSGYPSLTLTILLLVSELEKYSVQDKLAPYLDHTSHRVIKTWEHLACELNAPLETRLRCKLNNQYNCSQTQMLIDFIAVEMTQKTVKDLIVALRAIRRNDVVKIITAKYPGMFSQFSSNYFLKFPWEIYFGVILGDYL